MLASYIFGAIAMTVGFVLIILKKTTDVVNLQYRDWEVTFPVSVFLVVIGIFFPVVSHIIYSKTSSPSRDSPASAPPAATTGSRGPDAPLPTTSSPTLHPIKIDPANAPVPRCATFTGAGDVPAGHTLWLVNERSDTRPKYYFKRVIVNAAEHRWIATNAVIGSQDTPAGTPYTIYAVLVDDLTNQLINEGYFKGGVANIPDTALRVAQIQISRSGDGNDCKGR